jgi:peptide/nickel transport system substrate-binding protein
MHKRVLRLPKQEQIEQSIRSFSPAEKALFGFFAVLLIVSALLMLYNINRYILTEVPASGGSYVEGIIGSPRFINPLLATSDADRDLTALVYSGLLKAIPEGYLVPDLAQSYSISSDGLTYDFILRENIFFHDGTPITADDIIFTIEKARDSAIKSPKRASWDGVSAQKINGEEVRFTLKQPYAPFLENATIGILPYHLWKDVDAEQFPFSKFNIEPIGSGPYKLENLKRNSSGTPTNYELVPFSSYSLGKPYIKSIKIVFYPSEDALIKGYKSGYIESINSISSDKLKEVVKKESRIERSPLPRIFAVFFNQNQAPIFANTEVRRALNAAIDKKKIVDEVLSGYGTDISGPLPPGILKQKRIIAASDENKSGNAEERSATLILQDDGWEWNIDEVVWEKKVNKETQRLQFSLATSNITELKKAAEIIVSEWKKIGIKVDLNIFEVGDLNQNIIRPRKYDAILFGEIIGRGLDLFAFWHSSQRNDPGLNIAMYANINADALLKKAREELDKEERNQKYMEFEKEVKADISAIFLYSPDFIYIVPERIKALEVGIVTTPGERFSNVHEWYIETDKVWDFFSN